MGSILKSLFSFFFPPVCLVCNREVTADEVLCFRCASGIIPVDSLHIDLGNHIVMVYAASLYTPVVRELVAGKFSRRWVAVEWLGCLVGKMMKRTTNRYDLVIPVPQFWVRTLFRGQNHAALMASITGRLIGVTYSHAAILRIRSTLLQSSVFTSQRAKNVAGAFAVCTDVRKKRILVVDDVFTTGATVCEIARALYRAGAFQVDVAVAARTPFSKES